MRNSQAVFCAACRTARGGIAAAREGKPLLSNADACSPSTPSSLGYSAV
ncbi:MAG: hypothetical protein IJF48_03005 [Clostridia bacterium]|nr:hypothetical protein [Clostridia bacterium]